MKRGGYYSAHTLGAAKVIENALTLGTRALTDPSLALPVDRRPFVIADYGYEDAKFLVCCSIAIASFIISSMFSWVCWFQSCLNRNAALLMVVPHASS